MNNDKIAELIAEARDCVENYGDALVKRLADALEALTANTKDEREAISRTVGGVLFNVLNFPEKAQPHLLGRDMKPLNDKLTDAILAAGFRRQGDGEVTVEWGVRTDRGDVEMTNRAGIDYLVARGAKRLKRNRTVTVTAWKEETE